MESDSDNPHLTNNEFCIYDDTFGHNIYTDKWVDFLVEKMMDNDEYDSLYINPPEIL